MAVTISDIAKQAGVTATTVSKVLNKSEVGLKISERTRQRVFEVVERMQYKPSFSARALRKGRTSTIGYLCGGIHSSFFSELTALAMQEAEKRGYHLLVSVTQFDAQKELSCLEMLLQRRVDGIILLSSALRPGIKLYHYLVEQKFPLVVINKDIEGLSCVVSDWKPGMLESVSHLKTLGHQRIGFVGQAGINRDSYSKRLAFLEACASQGIEPVEYDLSMDIEHACRFGQILAEDSTAPRAIIAFSDYIATGILCGLYERGATSPRPWSVVGMDGTNMGRYFCPPITSIAQNQDEILRHSFDYVLRAIESRESVPQKIEVPTQLILRSSA